MERLTKRYANGAITLNAAPYKMAQETVDIAVRNCEPITAAVRKLAEHEDAAEQGLLVELPCKVGDTVWYVPPAECKNGKGEYVVTGFCFDKGGCRIRTYNPKGVIIYFYLDYIGKTVFLTREEAKQALKEAEG